MNKAILVYVLFFLSTVYAMAQSSDSLMLVKLKKYYAAKDNYTCSMEIKVFSKHVGGEVVQTSSSSVSLSGYKKRMKIGAIEIISNDKYTFQINHEEKEFTVLKMLKFDTTNYNNSAVEALNVGFSKCKRIAIEGKISTFEIGVNSEQLVKMQVSFDTASFVLKKVILFYPKEQQEYSMQYDEDGNLQKVPEKKVLNSYRMEISYLEIKEELFPKTFFTYDDFIVQNNHKYYPKNEFRNYKYND